MVGLGKPDIADQLFRSQCNAAEPSHVNLVQLFSEACYIESMCKLCHRIALRESRLKRQTCNKESVLGQEWMLLSRSNAQTLCQVTT